MKNKRKRNKIKIAKIKYKKNKKISLIVLSIILLVIYLPCYLMIVKKYIKRKINLDNEITIKIVGNGTQYIVEQYQTAPIEVYINGVKQDSAGKTINIEGDEDTVTSVTMKFSPTFSSVSKLFFYLNNIIEIDLTNFDFSLISNMGGMFRGCTSLTSIKFGKCNTSSVTQMTGLFQECTQLTFVDLSNFDTSKVENMESMFYHCVKLKSLDLSSFNTMNLNNMNSMFYQCESLTTLDLSNFNTSNVVNMQSLFANCYSLISLNLDNFDTSNVSIMSLMFYKCSSLISLNLNSFNTSGCSGSHSIFTNVPTDLKFCSESSELSTISTQISSYTNNCEDACFSSNNTKILVENKKCTNDCKTDTSYQYEYNNICFIACPEDTHYSYDNMFLCQKNPEGYFLDDNNIYKKCYESCQWCSGEGDTDIHNCLTCKSGFRKIDDIGKENNCYSECDYYYYFDLSGNYECTEDNNCPSDFNKLISQKNKCINECRNDDTYKYEFNNVCYNSTCPPNTYVSSDNMYLCQIEPENYYLDNDYIYKPCYISCKLCIGEGNIDNHKCTACKTNYKNIEEIGKENNCYIECTYLYYFNSSDNYECTIDNNCPSDYNKLISEKNKCIDECKKDNTYRFEFNNKCYWTCPDDTYYSYDNMYLCQKNPEGYFLDELNIYKKCYDTCKFCYGEGDANNNNCSECKSQFRKIDEIGKEKNCYNDCDYFYYFDPLGNYACTEENACPSNYNKVINEKKKCIDDCKNDDIYQKEYNNICYNECPEGTHLKDDNIYICYKDPEGYYLDNNNIYKPCYSHCKSCKGAGDEINNNCNECISNYHLISNPNNINNCYEICNYYYYFNSSGHYHCTLNEKCPEEQRKLIKSKNKCIDDCSKDDVYKYEENNLCVKVIIEEGKILLCPINLPCEKNSECIETCSAEEFLQKECIINNKNNQTVQDSIIKSIKKEITSGNLNSIISNVINGDKDDFILYDNDSIYQISSSQNQNNNEYTNISSILLGDCEKELKRVNNINEDDDLIIFKIDIKEEGLKIPIIQYEIYNPYDLEKLDLDVCKDKNIDISIPVSIDEKNLFKYNSSDVYYNDICFSFTTEKGTDIVVKDRQSEYKDNNMSLCEANCNYISYNKTTKKVSCNCEVKNNITSVSDIKSSKDLLMYTFNDLKNSINLEIMKCYKALFSKKGLIKNYGSYILLFILLMQIISLFIFMIKGYKTIYTLVHDLVKINSEKLESKKEKPNNTNSNSNISGNIYHTEHKKKIKRKNIRSKSFKFKKIEEMNFHAPNKRKKNQNNNKHGIDGLSSKSNMHSKIDLNIYRKKKSSKKLRNKTLFLDNLNEENKINAHHNKVQLKTFNYFNDYEKNNFLYEEALQYDNRTYCQYYLSLIKQKHLIIFTFYTSNDYNSRIIKLCLFFFSFALLLTVNSLFFNYTTFHKIYQDSGSFNFIFQLPQIILSTIISSVINILVKTLSLTQKDILEIKNVKDNLQKKETNLIGCLKIKFFVFFTLSFLLLLLFWYYVSCFCCIYTNSQIHLIDDTIISFALSLIYPLFINFIPGIFRIPAIKAVNKDKEFSYKLSQIIQLI